MSSTINALTSGGGIAIAGDTSGQLQLQTNNGTTAVTIDTSQNVGIGTTPSAWGSGFKAIQFANYGSIAVDNTPTLQISQNCYFNGTSWIYNSTNAASNYYQLPSSSAPHVWRYAASGTAGNAITWSEAMRIASSGNLLINTTSDSINSKVAIVGNNYWSASFQCINGGGALLIGNTSGTSAYNAASFYNNGFTSGAGSITVGGSTTAYNTSSDYRLKENIAPMIGALAKVSALKPVTYTWKADGSAGEGFIAHELAEVVPDCVTGEKDAVNEDGSIKAQGIDTSFLVATLTAAIQELNAKVEAQAATITALQAKVGV